MVEAADKSTVSGETVHSALMASPLAALAGMPMLPSSASFAVGFCLRCASRSIEIVGRYAAWTSTITTALIDSIADVVTVARKAYLPAGSPPRATVHTHSFGAGDDARPQAVPFACPASALTGSAVAARDALAAERLTFGMGAHVHANARATPQSLLVASHAAKGKSGSVEAQASSSNASYPTVRSPPAMPTCNGSSRSAMEVSELAHTVESELIQPVTRRMYVTPASRVAPRTRRSRRPFEAASSGRG